MSDNYRNNSAKTLLKELFDLCQSDSLSEDGLREILNRHGCIPNNNLNISNYNFFRVACANEKVNEGIIRCLLDYFPDAASPTDDGCSPLHSALLFNKNVTLNMVQLLIDAAPTSVRSVHEGSSLPLHCLCHNENVDEKAAYDILTVLLETYPESIRHADDEGSLPIHIACWSGSSPEFCRVLVEAYPGSERIANDYDRLPLHYACGYNTVATVECLYKLHPDAINHLSTSDGEYPIIEAIRRMWHRNNPAAAVDIVKFLLDCDPNVRLQKFQGTMSLLHYACQTADQRGRNDSNRNAALQVINLLYGACPEYVLMEDNDGWIPLHSLCYNEKVDEMTAMGILKLLLEKCPESARHVDHRGSLPIHLAAAETARSPEFCRVLIEAYPGSERITDQFGMLPLHYACLNSTVVNTTEYLYKIYPDAINLVSIEEMYPIHYAITCLCDPRNPSATVDIDIVQFLLDCDPNIKLQKFQGTMSLLHYACLFEYNDSNRNAFLRVINLLHGACPEYVRMEDDNGWMPLHYLCNNEKVDEITAWNVLMLLLEKYPESVRHADKDGSLPIHHAGTSKSPEFCHVLIEAYPGSERIADVYGRLPFHYACWENTAATIEYLYKLHPDTIHHLASEDEFYPIHYAIKGLRRRGVSAATVDTMQFLLDCDPNVKLQMFRGTMSLLHFTSQQKYDDSNIEAGIQLIKVIYDAHPEAIEKNEIVSDLNRYHRDVQTFLNAQLDYSRQAKYHCLMMTPDEKGQLPLHNALQNNVTLGSVTLLVRGNPSAIRSFDNSGVIPLHIACQHYESASVVQYLLGLNRKTLCATDFENNTALHYACRGAKYDTIALLLDKYEAVSVSKRNDDKKLPIDLLWESDEVEDRESIEYTESVFRLLRAYPETLTIINAKQQAKLVCCSSQNAKKRKLGTFRQSSVHYY